VSREYSCQCIGSFFSACIFCWDRASCLASSSANTLRIPVFKAYCHVQLTFYTGRKVPIGILQAISTWFNRSVFKVLDFGSLSEMTLFWPKSRGVLLLFFSICQTKCRFYQLSHFLYWYELYPLICSAQTTDALAARCILISVVSVCGCTSKRPKRTKTKEISMHRKFAWFYFARMLRTLQQFAFRGIKFSLKNIFTLWRLSAVTWQYFE